MRGRFCLWHCCYFVLADNNRLAALRGKLSRYLRAIVEHFHGTSCLPVKLCNHFFFFFPSLSSLFLSGVITEWNYKQITLFYIESFHFLARVSCALTQPLVCVSVLSSVGLQRTLKIEIRSGCFVSRCSCQWKWSNWIREHLIIFSLPDAVKPSQRLTERLCVLCVHVYLCLEPWKRFLVPWRGSNSPDVDVQRFRFRSFCISSLHRGVKYKHETDEADIYIMTLNINGSLRKYSGNNTWYSSIHEVPNLFYLPVILGIVFKGVSVHSIDHMRTYSIGEKE